jgi:cobyric acid synthase
MSKATCIMVQGTMSGAGKSLLCAALCRIFAQDGWRVAPFKSQNMALNSFVTRDGLEMGRAQVVQAQAAGVEPDVRMNPILLKPSSDIGSQVIVNGEVRGQMPAAEYFRRKKQLIPDILAAYNSLAEDFDIIVIEGAGSPAEINLKADDIVNIGCRRGQRSPAAAPPPPKRHPPARQMLCRHAGKIPPCFPRPGSGLRSRFPPRRGTGGREHGAGQAGGCPCAAGG